MAIVMFYTLGSIRRMVKLCTSILPLILCVLFLASCDFDSNSERVLEEKQDRYSLAEEYTECVVANFFNRVGGTTIIPADELEISFQACIEKRVSLEKAMKSFNDYDDEHLSLIDLSIQDLVFEILNVEG